MKQLQLFDDFGYITTMTDSEFRITNPIEYVLKSLRDDIKVEKFDILNALHYWENIKPAYLSKNDENDGHGNVYDFLKKFPSQ